MRTSGLVVMWLLSSAIAIGVAWTGVGVLDDDLVDPAPAVILSEVAGPSPDASASQTAPLVVDSSTSTSTTVSAPASSTASTGSTSSTTETTGITGGASSSTSERFSTTATTAGQTSATEAPATTRTFDLIGGSAAISFSPTGPKVLWATPNPGFEVEIELEPPGIKVEFRSNSHRSEVEVWWSDGPRHEIEERPEG